MNRIYAIFGRCAYRIGLLGLGASTLLASVSAIAGAAPSASGARAGVNLRLDFGGDFRSTHHDNLPRNWSMSRQTLGQDGGSDIHASGGKLILLMDRTASAAPSDAAPSDTATDASGQHAGPAVQHSLATASSAVGPVGTSETPRNDSRSPNQNSSAEVSDELGGIPLQPGNSAPPFSIVSHAALVSMAKHSVPSLYCIGFMGLNWTGQNEQSGGQRGANCETGPKSPASHPMLFLSIPLL